MGLSYQYLEPPRLINDFEAIYVLEIPEPPICIIAQNYLLTLDGFNVNYYDSLIGGKWLSGVFEPYYVNRYGEEPNVVSSGKLLSWENILPTQDAFFYRIGVEPPVRPCYAEITAIISGEELRYAKRLYVP